MIVEDLDWGVLKGKMKLTPEQAKEMLGYDLDPRAKGVIFRVQNGKQIVQSLMPQRRLVTEKTKPVSERHLALARMTKVLLRDVIHPNWEPMVKGKPLTGSNLFHQYNCKNLGLPARWKKLVLTIGEMPMPGFNPFYCPRQNIIVMKMSGMAYKKIKENMDLKVAVLEPVTLNLHYPLCMPEVEQPALAKGLGAQKAIFVKLPFKMQRGWSWKKERPIVIAYSRDGDVFSNSNAKTLEVCEEFNVFCTYKNRKNYECRYKLGIYGVEQARQQALGKRH